MHIIQSHTEVAVPYSQCEQNVVEIKLSIRDKCIIQIAKEWGIKKKKHIPSASMNFRTPCLGCKDFHLWYRN
jgi:hypothetical protein